MALRSFRLRRLRVRRARIASAVGLAVMAMGITGFTTSAMAAPGCDDIGDTYAWSQIATPWAVTHATRYEHFTNGTGEFKRTAAHQLTLTAGGSVHEEGSGGVGIGIFKLGVKTGFELKGEGSKTSSGGVSVTEKMNQNGVYIFYDGHHKVSGSFTHTYCADHTHVVHHQGTVYSFDAATQGAVFCKVNPGATTLAYLVKQIYC